MNKTKFSEIQKAIIKGDSIIILFIFLFGLFLRIVKMIIDPLLLRDSIFYMKQADEWFNSGKYVTIIQDGKGVTPPLPIYFIKELMSFGYNTEIAGRSIAIFTGAMIPVVGYIIAKKIFKKKQMSLICGMILCFHPSLISMSIQPLRENLYLFFIGLLIICIIDGVKREKKTTWLLGGMLLAIAGNCRYEALEVLLILPIAMYYAIKNKLFSLHYGFKCIASFYLSFILSVGILLLITDYDISFITKISKYKDSVIDNNVFQDFIYNSSEISQ